MALVVGSEQVGVQPRRGNEGWYYGSPEAPRHADVETMVKEVAGESESKTYLTSLCLVEDQPPLTLLAVPRSSD